ncbi:MAG: MCE family protein [Balneolaceae bacterium]|nr:MCE family protein [Balneolaceae bacterium]
MNLNNELKIGIVVLTATIIAFFGFRFMRDEPLFSSVNILNTKYESVEGLIRGSSVYMKGFKVGSVRQLQYLPEEDSVLVVISITEPIQVTKGSYALLASPDFLGSATIQIMKSRNSEIVEWEGFIPGKKKTGILDAFSSEGASMADSVQVTLDLVNNLLRGMNEIENGAASDIKSTVSNFKSFSEVLENVITSRKHEIDSMIVATNTTMQNLSSLSDSSSEDVSALLSNLEAFSADLDELSASLEQSSQSLESILSKMDTGDGTLSKMLNDPSLYNNLDSLTFNLNELIQNIQENPKDYLKHMRLIEIF